jgi:hypothetical protein
MGEEKKSFSLSGKIREGPARERSSMSCNEYRNLGVTQTRWGVEEMMTLG